MKVNNNILCKKPSDNTTTRNSSFIRNDNNIINHMSNKFNSNSDSQIKINNNSNNNFFEALNMILENNNLKSNSKVNNNNKNIKEISFESLNTSEFDNNKEITIEHLNSPIEKNIIKSGNILMKIGSKNGKNKSELPNIVELEEEDLILCYNY